MSGEMSPTEAYIMLGVLAFIFGAWILRPILRIWSVNRMFGTKIKQNPETWAASSYLISEVKSMLDRNDK